MSEGRRKGWWRGKRTEVMSRAALAVRTFLSRRAAHMAETWVVCVCVCVCVCVSSLKVEKIKVHLV